MHQSCGEPEDGFGQFRRETRSNACERMDAHVDKGIQCVSGELVELGQRGDQAWWRDFLNLCQHAQVTREVLCALLGRKAQRHGELFNLRRIRRKKQPRRPQQSLVLHAQDRGSRIHCTDLGRGSDRQRMLQGTQHRSGGELVPWIAGGQRQLLRREFGKQRMFELGHSLQALGQKRGRHLEDAIGVAQPLVNANTCVHADLFRTCRLGNHLAQSHILLQGEPGNGKTVLAEALAGELCIAFLEVTYGPVASKWVGELAALLTRTFALARASAPCVMFIDDIDSFLKSRDAQGSYAEMPVVTNVMLTEMVALCRTGECSHSRSTG